MQPLKQDYSNKRALLGLVKEFFPDFKKGRDFELVRQQALGGKAFHVSELLQVCFSHESAIGDAPGNEGEGFVSGGKAYLFMDFKLGENQHPHDSSLMPDLKNQLWVLIIKAKLVQDEDDTFTHTRWRSSTPITLQATSNMAGHVELQAEGMKGPCIRCGWELETGQSRHRAVGLAHAHEEALKQAQTITEQNRLKKLTGARPRQQKPRVL